MPYGWNTLTVPYRSCMDLPARAPIKSRWSYICLGAILWLLLKHSVIGFCFYTWAQGFICLGAILWLLLKHSVIGFCFILGLKGSFVWVLFFGYYSTIQLSVLFFYRLGSRVTYLPLQVYIFVVSGSCNSRPDSRRHATSGCHTQGS